MPRMTRVMALALIPDSGRFVAICDEAWRSAMRNESFSVAPSIFRHRGCRKTIETIWSRSPLVRGQGAVERIELALIESGWRLGARYAPLADACAAVGSSGRGDGGRFAVRIGVRFGGAHLRDGTAFEFARNSSVLEG